VQLGRKLGGILDLDFVGESFSKTVNKKKEERALVQSLWQCFNPQVGKSFESVSAKDINSVKTEFLNQLDKDFDQLLGLLQDGIDKKKAREMYMVARQAVDMEWNIASRLGAIP
jgi:hypothetical protein